MNDLKPHKHGDEGEGSTHYACPEMMKRYGGKVGCCACHKHQCKTDTSMEELEEKIKIATWEIQEKRQGYEKQTKHIMALIRNEFSSLVSKIEGKRKARETAKGYLPQVVDDVLEHYHKGYNKGIDDAIALIEKETR